MITYSEEKRCSLTRGRLDPHTPAVPLDDLFADGQPDTCARIFLPSMQALEDVKDALGMPRLESNSVIAHGKAPLLSVLFGGDVDAGALTAAELDGIAEQVLQHEAKLLCVGCDCRQWIVRDLCVTFLDRPLQI